MEPKSVPHTSTAGTISNIRYTGLWDNLGILDHSQNIY